MSPAASWSMRHKCRLRTDYRADGAPYQFTGTPKVYPWNVDKVNLRAG